MEWFAQPSPGADFFDKLGWDAPAWLVSAVGAVVVVAALVALVKPLIENLRPGGALLAKLRGHSREHQQHVRSRQLFADHIESQLRRISEKEDWRDSRFAELEAHVEIEGDQRSLLGFRLPRRRSGPRRVKSLSKGLRRSTERLILLQGEPGAGKSVALRHLAHLLVTEAMHSRRPDSRIPIYVNLRGFQPAAGPVTRDAVREFVLASLNRANSRDVEEFLDAEFDKGLKEGTWIFLFDSFDEIPAILSATEAGGAVEEYADAVYDFLHTMNRSRGIVASREFKGPRGFGWPRFTVLRLSSRQRLDLIRRAHLTRAQEDRVVGGLAAAGAGLTDFAGNPMMLGLLCAYVKSRGSFPDDTHILFDDYLNARLERDQERVQRRFGLTPEALRRIAEYAAFSMAAETRLGLTPARDDLAAAIKDAFGDVPDVAPALDALEFVKIATKPEAGALSAQFSFAHRRFQEFFATCVVLREPHRVPAEALALDGRWRETAVTMLQTQRTETDPDQLVNRIGLVLSLPGPGEATSRGYPWPPNSLHVLNLLSEGVPNPADRVPAPLRGTIGALILDAYRRGRRLDRKWATEVAALAPPAARDEIIGGAAASPSALLQAAAFAQAGRLRHLPSGLDRHIRRLLVGLSARGELRREKPTHRAQLGRLSPPDEYLRAMRLLLVAPAAEAFVVLFMLVFTVVDIWRSYQMYLSDLSSYALRPSVEPSLLEYGSDTFLFVVSLLGPMTLTFFVFRVLPVVSSAAQGSKVATVLGRIAPSVNEGRQGLYGLATAVLAARCILAVVLATSFDDDHVGLPFVYVALWPVCVLSYVSGGGDTRYSRWPLIPLLEFGRLLRRALTGIRESAQAISVLFLGLGVVAAGTLIGAAASSDQRYGSVVVGAVIAVIVVIVAGGGMLGALVLMTWRPLSSALKRYSDSRRLGSLNGAGLLDAEATARFLQRLRSDSGVQAFVRKVRRGDVRVTGGAIAYLDNLAGDFERGLRRGAAGTRPVLTGFSVKTLGEGTLDEIALLCEERSR